MLPHSVAFSSASFPFASSFNRLNLPHPKHSHLQKAVSFSSTPLLAVEQALVPNGDNKESQVLCQDYTLLPRNVKLKLNFIVKNASEQQNRDVVVIKRFGLLKKEEFRVWSFLNVIVVQTPEGDLYCNGLRIKGGGPIRYAAYQAENKQAPSIQGSGWPDEAIPEAPSQVLVVPCGSSLVGTVTFESGRGRVIVRPGGAFIGKVIGEWEPHGTKV